MQKKKEEAVEWSLGTYVHYLDLNRWDGIRVGLGPGYGIVSGNVSGNTA